MKKALVLSTLLAGSAALGFGVVAIAQDGPPPHHGFGPDRPGDGMLLEELDTNKDGKISKAEVTARETQAFGELDTNRDGFASASEMAAFHEKKREEARLKMQAEMHQRMVEKLDTNGDGKISQSEFTNRPHPRFDLADSNDDGVIDEKEMEAAKERGKERFGRMKDWKEKRGEGHGFRR